MLDYATATIPSRGGAVRYSQVLAAYYTSIESSRSVCAEIEEEEPLVARSIGFSLGRLSASVHRCNSPLHRYAMSHRAPSTDYSLQLVTEGSLTIVSDDNELHVMPGDFVFIRPRRFVEYHAHDGGSETIGFHIPHALASSLAKGHEIPLDRVFSSTSGIGACVASLVRTITQQHRDLTIADRAALQTVVAEAIIQLGTSIGHDEATNSGRQELLNRLKAATTIFLDDPDLTPGAIAKRLNVSVRTLHRAFQSSGETFWNWVRDRRLERCHLDLTTPRSNPPSITEVAFRWGFNDLSTFDRNFRRRYGLSPRDARASSRLAN